MNRIRQPLELSRLAGVLCLISFLVGPGRVTHAPAQDRAVDALAETRLREMAKLAEAIHIQETTAAGPIAIGPSREPMVRYDDQPRRILDATLWAYVRRGRPRAVLKVEIYPRGQGLYGLVSTSSSTLKAETAIWLWESTRPGLEWKPLPRAPAPGDSERIRLVQMKELARRFSAFETEPSDRGRLTLRLLPKPIQRYADPQSGTQDGAIFTFAFGTNPELLLILESRKDAQDPPSWHYAFARLCGPEVSASLDGLEVWKAESGLPIPATLDTYMNRRLLRTEGAD